MNLIICDSKNIHLINKIKIDGKKNKLIIVGDRNKNFYLICKNIKFVSCVTDILKLKSKYHKYIFIDKIQYLDPEFINKIKYLSPGSFYASNFFGDDELYIMQVMGFLPDILTGNWHNEYINRCNLSKTDLKFDFLEKYIFTKNKEIFNFNKYHTLNPRNILITNKINKVKNCINGTKNISDFIDKYHSEEKIYLLGNIWSLNDNEDQEEYVNRLYKLR
jgi:hypothetical protein